jgi:calcineurin-like phosphoesterase family protein
MVWVITDTHFFDERAMQTYCNRPSNHTELILSNWRRKVHRKDLVIHLGDIFTDPKKAYNGILSEVMITLPGEKILVKGNHDSLSYDFYRNNGFSFVCDSFEYGGILFTHKPYENLVDNCWINVHGHLHNIDKEVFNRVSKDPWVMYSHGRLLALENTDYNPVAFEYLFDFVRDQDGLIIK